MMGKVQIEDNNWVRTEIGSTNGIHYIDRANKIDTYPEYDLPAKKAQKKNSLMLDIGSGWGRWLIAASRKSYIPIGLDLKIDHARSALKTIRHHQVNGYLVVGDLQDMPFQDDTFDLIWSF